MTAVFQIFKFAVTMVVQTEAYGAELKEVISLAEGEDATREAYLEKIEKLQGPAIENLKKGNGHFVGALWETVVLSKAPTGWVVDGLQPVLAEVLKIRKDQHVKIGTHLDEAWLMTFETIFSTPDLNVLGKLEGYEEIPADYFVLAIASDQGERASRWWYSVSEKHRTYFFNGLKIQNRHIKALKAALNPDDLAVSEIAANDRLPIVRRYLGHPFFHHLQPFNSGTLQQLINFKCLTVDEVLAEPDRWVDLHFRQGLAYLDIARIYRKNEQYPEALATVNKGMTTRLQFGNRLAHYLLERAQIYRDAGNIQAAQRSLDAVDIKQLDDGNEKLYDEIEASLEANE